MINSRTPLAVFILLSMFPQSASPASVGLSTFISARLSWIRVRYLPPSAATGQKQENPPPIFGEDIDAECPLDVDIHLPAAQDPAQPLVAEGKDATEGAWSLRNDDMDATTGEIISSRLRNGTDLNAAEGTPDLSINGTVPAEDDLVAVDVHNPTGLTNVFLNVYAMAAQDGRTKVKTHSGRQSPNKIERRLAIWKNPDRTGAVTLPLMVPAGKDRVWVEGLGAGRYRFVLFHIKDGDIGQARRVKAAEEDPHGRVTSGTITLDPPDGVPIECFKHVRLTVAVNDVFQKGRREHLFDVLWGGRPVFDGHLWPVPGTFTWEQSTGFDGNYLDGLVHEVRVVRTGATAGGIGKIAEVHGAFEPAVQAVGQPVRGSQRYEHRVRLRYEVEGLILMREEPVTLMVPDHVTIQPLPPLNQGFARPIFGTTYSFNLQVKYEIFDQHDRKLAGARDAKTYKRQYGARLQAYEALGMGAQATETNDQVRWQYVSPINPNRTFTVPINTKQRSEAIPSSGSLSSGSFTDRFELRLSNDQRRMLQDDIRADNSLASRRVLAVSQDVVVLLRNDAAEYDIRVARGNRLEFLAPQQRPTLAAPFGGLGFQFTLGGPNGTQLDTGNPDRVAANHNPPAPQ